MSSMAATTIGRLLALAVALIVALSACSNSSDDDIGAQLDEEAAASSTSTTDATTTSSSTTTESPPTTLSDEAIAEAEIRRVVTEWYQFPIDTSRDDNELRLEALTGLLRQRVAESDAQYAAEGVIHRSTGPAPIEIAGVDIDLIAGIAEVEACTGSADEFVDAETLEVLGVDDPEKTSTSVFQLQLVDEQWKINEWLPSELTPGGIVACEIV